MKLDLLPGLRWKGSLTILAKDATGYVVAFNAEGLDGGEPIFIYDHTVLTPRQLEDWTGYREDENHVELTTKRKHARRKP